MKDDDLVYGARSGIQKAIRRGDLDLAKTCFDLLWAESKHRNWLKWRTPILVMEEVWWMAGELAELMQMENKQEKDWRRFIYLLTVVSKQKDAEPLVPLAGRLKVGIEEERIAVELKKRLDAVNGDPMKVAFWLTEHLMDFRKMSDYESAALETIRKRVFAGGMLGDRVGCLGVMILVAARGLKKEEVKRKIEEDWRLWKQKHGSKPPKTVNLPWYVFDMHTMVGKMAMRVFLKYREQKGFGWVTERDLDDLWFYAESAWVPAWMRTDVEDPTVASPFEQVWWPIEERLRLSKNGMSPMETRRLWKKKMGAEMKKIVEWCIERRDR